MELIKKLGTKKNKNGNYISFGEFLCLNSECNKIVVKRLQAGLKAKSCGCITNKLKSASKKGDKNPAYKHGEMTTRLYNIWSGMKQKCSYIKHIGYKNYGGRGITVCSEWANDYTVFRDWALNNGYKDNLEINRINNNGNYEPSNCNWITQKENKQRKSFGK